MSISPAAAAGSGAASSSSDQKRRAFSPHTYETIEEPVCLRHLLLDDIYLFGGQFAVLCQFAHPSLAKGVFLHSNFAPRILHRLQNTKTFLDAAVHGTHEEKDAIFSMVHKYHRRVKGPGYDANDPELQKWTAATLFVSFVVVQDTFLNGFTRQQMERLYRETAIYATSLCMPPDMWPATLDDFWAYWNHGIATLEVTDMARELCRGLMNPINLPLQLRLARPLANLLTTHFLPDRLAREYGLQPTTLSWLQYQALVGTIRVTWPLLPMRLRCGMNREYMEQMKAAAKRIKQTGHW